LYLALYANKAVDTIDQRKNPIQRWYFLNIRKALDPNCDREDAIIGLPDDMVVRNFRGQIEQDYSTLDLQCKHELFPLAIVFNQVELTQWQLRYLQVEPSEMAERLARWNDLQTGILNRVLQYQIPVIELKRETPKEAVCQVFEKVNTGGVALNVFELLTATFAAEPEEFRLRENWATTEKRLKKIKVI
jgi:hypothetical protein